MNEAPPVRSTCPYCGVGCGVLATPLGGRDLKIAGDPDHPANRGKLCSKGTHLGETVGLEGRLLHPTIGDRRVSWDKALDLVARRFRETVASHGPDSVAFYVSGQLLTEDYYVANKLMKGFIGSGNIDTNSRLCMSSAVAGHVRAFGEDVVSASYDDLDEADLIVLIGSNTAWCHPIVFQRIQAAREARGTKIVVVDPRRTETCEDADLHLPIRPGSDVALMCGLLAYCRRAGIVDEDYLAANVSVPDGYLDGVEREHDLWTVAKTCDVSPDLLRRFFDMFVANPRTVTMFSQGINQALRGTDQVNAIINVHLATGRIGKPGAAPFSITGQPNAMGGREVGGLASTLAAHMDFAPDNVDRVRRFWSAPQMATRPGLKAVDMFRAVEEGRIKAIWIIATNPAVSMPDAGRVRDALAACPFVVVSEVVAQTDTSRHAHVRLPATGWGEKDGTVTNSERMISRQRGVLPAPGEARADWWIISEVGKRMGWPSAFGYDRPADIYREYARMTAYENRGARKLDLIRDAAIGNPAYDAMEPWRWLDRPFLAGDFPTPDRKARIVPVAQGPVADPLRDWPLTLNTGRYRDQWHTMTRTGLSPKLARHREEPLVEMHGDDIARYGLEDGGLARVQTPQAESLFRVKANAGQRRGEIFTPIHWTDRQSTGGRTGLLPRPLTDPHSGQPGFKSTPARVEKVAVEWRGFLILRGAGADVTPPCLWSVRISVPGGVLYELAGAGADGGIDACLPAGQRIEAADAARGTRRVAIVENGRLSATLFLTRTGELPGRDWLIAQLDATELAPTLLAGRAPGAQPDRGEVVCACFDVGLKTIIAAIREQQLGDVAAIGGALGAGTNCGSCRPALSRILVQSGPAAEPEKVHAAE